MKATLCDICGNRIVGKIPATITTNILNIYQCEVTYDLCGDCAKNLKRYMKQEEKKKKNSKEKGDKDNET